jgi:acyl carrier protein
MDRTAGTLDVNLIREQIRDYIARNFLFGSDASALDDGASLVEQGIVDDTGVLELVLFVEETYGVQATEDELLPENFDSVDNIVEYVAGKLAADE